LEQTSPPASPSLPLGSWPASLPNSRDRVCY